ncbi:MAG TPA: response regulator [Pyrinomonadaceae bacterium]
MRTSPIPLLILQSDLRVVSGNEAFYEVFEIEPEEAKGRSVYELANGEWNIPRLRELLENILPHEHWFHGFEITHTFENIGERTLLLNARRMEVEAGALERIVLAIDDVTDRKRVESERERLLKTEQDLRHVSEEANRLKDEFLAIMSHELRNPLNVILGYSELLPRTEETSRSPELLRTSEAIKRNALIQARLIRDLLDLSRLRSGKISLNNETVSLLVAVDHAVETARAEADAKNIAIEIAVFSEPLFVQGDSVRLEQILWNLFEMFRQGDAGMNRPHSGMGIGLAVVNQLVDLHKGWISAFSAGPAKGARFTLRFPLSVEVKTLPAPALKLVTALDNLSILVVDDSVETTEMLTTLLSIKGAKVIPATSGNEALQVMAEREVDVVLSDISMPGMDGFEFLKRLRQIPGRTDVPVLALTGFGRPEDIERAKAEGFFSHVTKPFQVDALIGVLQKLPKKQR